MTKIKPNLIFWSTLAVILLVVSVCVHKYYNFRSGYTLADLGIGEPEQTDCAVVANSGENYPVSVSFTSENVSKAREQIKDLVAKYKGEINQDSFSSYPVAN